MRRLVLALLLVWPMPAGAVTRYMASSGGGGSNGNSCAASTSASSPKLTQTGAQGALACMSAGDLLIIRGGTYDENVDVGLIPAGGGTEGTRTIIRAAAGETVWIRPSTQNARGSVYTFGAPSTAQAWITLDGINIDASLNAAGAFAIFDGDDMGGGTPGYAHHLRITNLEFKGSAASTTSHGVLTRCNPGAPQGCTGHNEFTNLVFHDIGQNHLYHGMYLTGPDDVVDNLECYNNTGACVQVQAAGALNITIKNSKFHNPRATVDGGGTAHWGVVISNGGSATVFNNVIYDMLADGNGYGIHNYAGSASNVYNNTCVNAWKCYVFGSGTNAFRNNISYQPTAAHCEGTAGECSQGNNLINGTDPRFVNVGTHDFHLQNTPPTVSPAINAGTTIGVVATDKEGTARPQGASYDIGAYEWTSTGTLPGNPTAFSPADLTTGVSKNTAVTFTTTNATSCDIFFGTTNTPTLFSDAYATGSALNATNWEEGYSGYDNQLIGNQQIQSVTANSNVGAMGRAKTALANDQWAQLTITQLGGTSRGLYVGVRGTNAPTLSGYMGGVNEYGIDHAAIFRIDNGSFTKIWTDSNTTTWNVADTIKLTIIGSTLRLYKGSTELGSVVDSTYPSGSTFSQLYSSTANGARADDYATGTMGPAFVGNQPDCTTYQPGALLFSTTYYFKAVGLNVNGSSPDPSTISFITELPPLPFMPGAGLAFKGGRR